jgi:hypothetical protein
MLDKKTVEAEIRGERARAMANIASRTKRPETAFWISFAEDGFRGAIIIHSEDFSTAIVESHAMGINPGGQVMAIPIDPVVSSLIPERWKNRLLSKAECVEFDKELTAIREATRHNARPH